MPLKIAAAFALSFVMSSAVFDISPPVVGEFLDFKGGPLEQFMAGDSIYGLLWKLATVVVFWKAVFEWALDGAEGKAIIDKVKGSGEQLGMLASKTVAESIPLPGLGEGQNLLTALDTIQNAPNNYQTAQNNRVDRANNPPGEDRDASVATNTYAGNLRGATPAQAAEQTDKHIRKIGTDQLKRMSGKMVEELKKKFPNIEVDKLKAAFDSLDVRKIQDELKAQLGVSGNPFSSSANYQPGMAPQTRTDGGGNNGNTTNQNNSNTNNVTINYGQNQTEIINSVNEAKRLINANDDNSNEIKRELAKSEEDMRKMAKMLKNQADFGNKTEAQITAMTKEQLKIFLKLNNL